MLFGPFGHKWQLWGSSACFCGLACGANAINHSAKLRSEQQVMQAFARAGIHVTDACEPYAKCKNADGDHNAFEQTFADAWVAS